MNFNELELLMEDYASKYSGKKSSIEIAKMMKENHPGINQPLQHLSLMIYQIMSEQDDPKSPREKVPAKDVEISGEITDQKYDVVDDHYIWDSKRAGTIRISVPDADKLFFEYSRYGLDLSQEQVRNKHGFSISEWNSIKITLWLYKNSNIFSPHTVENTPVDELNEMVSDQFDMKSNDKKRLIEEEYRKHTLKEYKKVIRNYQIDQFATTEFIHELHSLLPEKEVITQNRFSSGKDDPNEIFVAIADLHVGAKTEGLKNTPDFNMQVLQDRLDLVAAGINKQRAKTVTLSILGDIIESFTGLNHPNSWQSMQWGQYGAQVVFSAYTILGEFFEKINNLKNIKIIGGNHDRMSSNNKEDRKSAIAELIFFMLQEKYGSIFKLEYDVLFLTHDMPSTRLILAHGDRKFLKKSKKNSILDMKISEFGTPDKFNLVLTGHLHSRGVNEDKQNLRWYQVPSIFSGNFYSEESGWNARPGYFILKEDSDTELPIIIDQPL